MSSVSNAALVGLLVAQLNVSPFEGDWRTDIPPNLKQMSIGSVPAGISFAVTADKVKITDHSVSPSGRLRDFDNVFQTDGKPHSTEAGWTVVATWSSPYMLDLMHTGRGVRVVTVHVTYSLSTDRKTLTRRGVYSADGHIEERVFYR